MPFETISALIRHGLTTAGGYLVSTGLVDASGAQAFVGAGMTLAGLAWSILRKWNRQQRTGTPG